MTAPSLFVSYSRDSAAHNAAVLELAQGLRGEGVDVRLDQFEQAPPEGWPKWMLRQLAEVDFVLVVCTASYCRRFEGKEDVGVGQGVAFESLIITQGLFEANAKNTRFLPVVFAGASVADIPGVLRPFQRFVLPGAREALYRLITAQPAVVADPIGTAVVAEYLEWLRTQPSGLDLIGVGGGDVQLELAEVYVPLRIAGHRELERMGSKEEGRLAGVMHEDFELTELFARVGACRHALLLGRPGSGKTTALRKLAQQCLREGAAALLLPENFIPVFVRLRRFTAADLDQPLPAFVARELHEVSAGVIDGGCAAKLWSRGVLLLLDGLDEIADEPLRARLCGYLRDELQRGSCGEARVVVSSRFAGHDGVRVRLDESFARCDVRPLNAEQVRTLVRRWFSEASRCLPQLPLTEARVKADALIEALEAPRFGLGAGSDHRLKIMYSTPLLLTLLCVVVQQGREIPRNRAAFYEESLRVLLLRWREAKGMKPLLDIDTAIALLRPLAYALHTAGQREEVAESDLVEHIHDRLAELGQVGVDSLTVFDWLYRGTGVLTELAPNQYGFFHLGLQEYLAALQVASKGERLLDALAAGFAQPWWHEVARLLVSMPARNMFGPLMRRLLAGPALLEQSNVLRDCVLEAAEVDVAPFIERLEQVRPAESTRRQVELLRLVFGRSEPALLACAARLQAHAPDAEVRAMAERVLASAARPAAGGALAFDAVIVAVAEDMGQASELTTRQRGLGLAVWPKKGSVNLQAYGPPVDRRAAPRVTCTLAGAVIGTGDGRVLNISDSGAFIALPEAQAHPTRNITLRLVLGGTTYTLPAEVVRLAALAPHGIGVAVQFRGIVEGATEHIHRFVLSRLLAEVNEIMEGPFLPVDPQDVQAFTGVPVVSLKLREMLAAEGPIAGRLFQRDVGDLEDIKLVDASHDTLTVALKNAASRRPEVGDPIHLILTRGSFNVHTHTHALQRDHERVVLKVPGVLTTFEVPVTLAARWTLSTSIRIDRRALEALLFKIFEHDSDFRRWITSFDDDDLLLSVHLPGTAASLHQLVHSALDTFERFGILVPEIIDSLVEVPGARQHVSGAAGTLFHKRKLAERFDHLDVSEGRRFQAATLAKLIEERDDHTIRGLDRSGIDRKIVALKREMRDGPNLHAGDFLGNGRFSLITQIGRGGFSTVWKVLDREHNDFAALKVLHGQYVDDASHRGRFIRGSRIMAMLTHPRIVRVRRVAVSEDNYWHSAMDYFPHGDLRHALRERELTVRQRLVVMTDLAEALAHTHDRSIVHRDVKPENVLLDANLRGYLTDFDLVKASETTGGTRLGDNMGTWIYVAPEAVNAAAAAGPPTDVYAFGIVLLESFLDRPLRRQDGFQPTLVAEKLPLEPALRTVIRCCVAESAAERTISMREVYETLKGLLEGAQRD